MILTSLGFGKFRFLEELKIQSNLEITNFLVTKCSLSLWIKTAYWSRLMVPQHQFVPYQTMPYHQVWLYRNILSKLITCSRHRSLQFFVVYKILFFSWSKVGRSIEITHPFLTHCMGVQFKALKYVIQGSLYFLLFCFPSVLIFIKIKLKVLLE